MTIRDLPQPLFSRVNGSKRRPGTTSFTISVFKAISQEVYLQRVEQGPPLQFQEENPGQICTVRFQKETQE